MEMGFLLYVFVAIGILFMLIVGAKIWQLVTFRDPLLHGSPAAYARLNLVKLPETPENLRTGSAEQQARGLHGNGFKDIGCYKEVIGSEVPTRQFFSAEHTTYASMFITQDEQAFVSYTTQFDDGMILFTCTSTALAGIFGKLINQAEADPNERLDLHLRELGRMKEDGGKPQGDGTLDDRMKLCKEWYRYHTGAYLEEEPPPPEPEPVL